jgi:hypothetical protein
MLVRSNVQLAMIDIHMQQSVQATAISVELNGLERVMETVN